jgi:hypothetical protein
MTTTQTPRIIHGGPAAVGHAPAGLRRWACAITAGLLAQVVLGAATAALVSIPTTGDGFEGASPHLLLTSHLLVGLYIGITAVVLLVVALRAHHRFWTALSWTGLLGAATSMVCGHLFLVTDGGEWASVVMAGGCAVSLTAYVVGLSSARGR